MLETYSKTLKFEKIFGKKKQIVTPGEMETVNLKPELVEKIKQGKEVTVELVK